VVRRQQAGAGAEGAERVGDCSVVNRSVDADHNPLRLFGALAPAMPGEA